MKEMPMTTSENEPTTEETLRERLAVFVACAQALQELSDKEKETVLATLATHFGLD
jgi:hypothetical protein